MRSSRVRTQIRGACARPDRQSAAARQPGRTGRAPGRPGRCRGQGAGATRRSAVAADQPGGRAGPLAVRQLGRDHLSGQAAAARLQVWQHRGVAGHQLLAGVRVAAGQPAGLAGAGRDRLRVRRGGGDRPRRRRRAEPAGRERGRPADADAPDAAAVRADPGVHRLVRDRRAAEDAADRDRRRRSRCTSTRSPASATWTPGSASWAGPAPAAAGADPADRAARRAAAGAGRAAAEPRPWPGWRWSWPSSSTPTPGWAS